MGGQKLRNVLSELSIETASLLNTSDSCEDALDVKSLVFRTSCMQQPRVLAIVPLLRRTSYKKLRCSIACSDVSLASVEIAEATTGFKVGVIPPFGHVTSLPTYVDQTILNHGNVICGAGEPGLRLHMSSLELVDVTRATVIDLCEGEPGEVVDSNQDLVVGGTKEACIELCERRDEGRNASLDADFKDTSDTTLNLFDVVVKEDGVAIASLAGIAVVCITPDASLVLRADSCKSESTRTAINAMLRHCGAGIEVLSASGNWTLVGPGISRMGVSSMAFEDGIKLPMFGVASSQAYNNLCNLSSTHRTPKVLLGSSGSAFTPSSDSMIIAERVFAEKAMAVGVEVRIPILETEYELEGEVMGARRVGKWLLFATIKVEPDSRVLQACRIATGEEVEEVQMVAGRRLFEAVGSEQMGILLKQVKRGSTIRARGRPYRNPRSLTIDLKIHWLEVVRSASVIDVRPVQKTEMKKRQSAEVVRDRKESHVSYFQLSLPFESVHVVEGDSGCTFFHEAVKRLLRLERSNTEVSSLAQPCLVGIDAEWQPMSSGSAPSKVSILQIATRTEVFIIDLLSMSDSCLSGEGVETIVGGCTSLKSSLAQLLGSASLHKVGFSMANDFRMLCESYPCFREIMDNNCCCVDLAREAGEYFQGAGKIWQKGLSALVERLFGHPLDKREQCSSWGERPLSESQLRYAALDAHVLISVYDELRNQ